MLPLPGTTNGMPTGRRRPDGAHAGLWHEKFFCGWPARIEPEAKVSPAEKQAWITGMSGLVGDKRRLDEAVARTVRLIGARRGLCLVLAAESRFVTGLGRSHPLENGFSFHPTLGTPFLPGSSLKGVTRSWAEAEPGSDDERVRRIFGDRNHAGSIAFLDAIPTSPPRLEADVMTPHYANWTTDDPPGDWRSPTPIQFLTVGAGASFVTGILPLRPAQTEPGDLELVATWIEDLMEWEGAGAKTAVGYGRFQRNRDAENQLISEQERRAQEAVAAAEEQRRLASLSPLDRRLEEIAAASPNDPHSYTAWLRALEKGEWTSDEDRRAVAMRIKQQMEALSLWKPESKKKNPSKDKPHQRTLEVMRYLEP